MKTDIEIAQSVEMKPITEIAAFAGISDEYLEQPKATRSPHPMKSTCLLTGA